MFSYIKAGLTGLWSGVAGLKYKSVSRRSRYFHFSFLHHTNTPMLVAVIFITMKITFNYPLLSLWFQRHKHWVASYRRKQKNSKLCSLNTGDNRQILGRSDDCKHQNCKKGFMVNPIIFSQENGTVYTLIMTCHGMFYYLFLLVKINLSGLPFERKCCCFFTYNSVTMIDDLTYYTLSVQTQTRSNSKRQKERKLNKKNHEI